MKIEDSLKQDIEMLERELRIARELLQKQLQNSITFNTAAFDPTTTRQVEFFLTYCKPAPASFPNDGAERDWSKLEAAADSDIPEIDTKDLRINAWCSTSNSGFGYKQDDTVSILHVPSGIEVVVTGERSIHACRAKAMEQLEEKYAEWVKSKLVGAAEKPLRKIVQISTTAAGMVALCDDGELFGWSYEDKQWEHIVSDFVKFGTFNQQQSKGK